MKGVRVDGIILAFCEPCPVCGKQPKIYRDFAYEDAGFGAWCTIECKPFLRKPHLKIESGKAFWKRALVGAVDSWNVKAHGGTDND